MDDGVIIVTGDGDKEEEAGTNQLWTAHEERLTSLQTEVSDIRVTLEGLRSEISTAVSEAFSAQIAATQAQETAEQAESVAEGALAEAVAQATEETTEEATEAPEPVAAPEPETEEQRPSKPPLWKSLLFGV